MLEFKSKATNIMINIILVATLIIVVFTLKGDYNNLFYLVLVFVFGYLLSLLFSKKRVIKIVIYKEAKSIDIYYRKYTFIKKKENYPVKMLDVEFSNKMNIRGVKKEQLEIKRSNLEESIVIIVADFDGWSSETLKKICNTINKLKE